MFHQLVSSMGLALLLVVQTALEVTVSISVSVSVSESESDITQDCLSFAKLDRRCHANLETTK